MVWHAGLATQLDSVHSLSGVWFFATPRTATCQASLSFTNSQSLLNLMSIESVTPSTISSSVIPFSSHLQYFPVSGCFSNEWVLHVRWLSSWRFSFSIGPSKEYSGLIKGCCCESYVTPGYLTSRGEDFDLGSETRLDYLELFCVAKFY